MRRRWPLLPLVALLAVPAACSDDGLKEGEARLEVDGRATIERADGDRESVDGGTDVSSGDRVWIDEGSALMRLSGGTQLELREEVDDAAAPTTLVMGKRPVLEAGDLLVMTPKSIGIEADGTEVEVTDGAARLTRAFGMSVASYDADVTLDSAGVPAHVPALREMVVPDLGRPPQRPRPILYNEDARRTRGTCGSSARRSPSAIGWRASRPASPTRCPTGRAAPPGSSASCSPDSRTRPASVPT